jgi:Immunoglobulin I-set domain.
MFFYFIISVPARIASFSRRMVAGAGQNIMLACQAVGLPAPNRSWRGPSGNSITASSGNRHHRLHPDGGLILGPLKPEDAGNYSCLAENVFGRDEVTFGITVQVPPGPPHLSVPATTTRSLSLQWRLPDNGGSPVTGESLYSASCKRLLCWDNTASVAIHYGLFGLRI